MKRTVIGLLFLFLFCSCEIGVFIDDNSEWGVVPSVLIGKYRWENSSFVYSLEIKDDDIKFNGESLFGKFRTASNSKKYITLDYCYPHVKKHDILEFELRRISSSNFDSNGKYTGSYYGNKDDAWMKFEWSIKDQTLYVTDEGGKVYDFKRVSK